MIVGDCQAIVGRAEATEFVQRQIAARSVRCGHKLPCLSESMRWQSLNIMEALLNDPTTGKGCHAVAGLVEVPNCVRLQTSSKKAQVPGTAHICDHVVGHLRILWRLYGAS
jgi:hypothetical protein